MALPVPGRSFPGGPGSGKGEKVFQITRELHFCYGHRLLDYEGRCSRLHGHNGVVLLTLESEALDTSGMVADFGVIRERLGRWIDDELDHRMILRQDDPAIPALRSLGEALYVVEFNPTAENLARFLFRKAQELELPVREVRFVESPTCWAVYRP
jgi:6-pyruvoyltetrahydropterin/6-carboxytetrahydropterin synthase